MNVKIRGPIFLLGLVILYTLLMGALNAAMGEGRVEKIKQDDSGSHQIALKARLIQETITDEKKGPARPPQKKRTTPRAEEQKPITKGKTRPLKKFVPSEKIPADQAVDFPADI